MRPTVCLFLAAAAIAFFIDLTSNAEQQPNKKEDETTARFDELKEKTTKLFSEWAAKQIVIKEPKLSLARRTSQDEAKLTFSFKAGWLEVNQESHLATFYFKYYDGAWTVMRWESSLGLDKSVLQPFQEVALRMDESNKK